MSRLSRLALVWLDMESAEHRLGTRVAESADSEVNHAVSGADGNAGTGTSGAPQRQRR